MLSTDQTVKLSKLKSLLARGKWEVVILKILYFCKC